MLGGTVSRLLSNIRMQIFFITTLVFLYKLFYWLFYPAYDFWWFIYELLTSWFACQSVSLSVHQLICQLVQKLLVGWNLLRVSKILKTGFLKWILPDRDFAGAILVHLINWASCQKCRLLPTFFTFIAKQVEKLKKFMKI